MKRVESKKVSVTVLTVTCYARARDAALVFCARDKRQLPVYSILSSLSIVLRMKSTVLILPVLSAFVTIGAAYLHFAHVSVSKLIKAVQH